MTAEETLRILPMASAKTAILDAMDQFTHDCDTLTAMEWMRVLNLVEIRVMETGKHEPWAVDGFGIDRDGLS
jgi:hypothetical protein